MKNKFEDDEVLSQLSKSARKTKAPKLEESIIHAAISSKPNTDRGKILKPALLLNLAGGAAVLVGVFVLTGPLSSTNQEVLSSGDVDQYSKISSEMSLARGHEKITEENLLSREGWSLAEHGASAVGNYVSNSPSAYVDEIWNGQGGTSEGNLWVFVVSDAVYIANGDNRVSISTFFTENNLNSFIDEEQAISYSDQIASSSDAAGIRLLIQGDSNILYPIVVPVNEKQGSLYTELRDYILSSTFTKVPTL